MLKDIYETLKQVLVIIETQKRQEEDIKELKRFMIEVTTILRRVSDRVEMTDTRSKSDLENLAAQTKLELENLALKMQIAMQEGASKPHPTQPKTDRRKALRGKKRKTSTRTLKK
jgi:hypothetical protein